MRENKKGLVRGHGSRMRTEVEPRFAGGPAREMVEHVSSRRIRETRETFHQELWNHQAHTIMLAERGILARTDAAAILRVLDEIDRIGPKRFPVDSARGELLFSVEAHLARRIGEDAASRMHTGRSRGDLYVCIERMHIRERLLDVADRLLRLLEGLLTQAGQHVDTVMPGTTLLQHAQPMTFAHYLLSFADRFLRDLARLRESYARVNQSPMGSAILSGTSFPVDRPRMAVLLGFDGVLENTRDASTARDVNLETIAHTAICGENAAALAEDLILWATYEFGMVEPADGYAGTSSIMPQKKNPSALTRVRHLAAEVVGATMTVFTQLKTHSEELNDFEATGPVVWRGLETAAAALDLLAGSVSTLRVKSERMAELAGANFIQAAHLAETIARAEGIGFRIAHRIVARLVRTCLEQEIPPASLRPDLVNEAAVAVTGRPLRLTAADLTRAMDLRAILRARPTPGGPGRRQVRSMLRRHAAALGRDRDWVADRREELTAAREATRRLARRLASTHPRPARKPA